MAQDHHIQSQRFELKYIIEPPQALAVRDFVQSYLDLDEFGAEQPNCSYPVHSLYFDSPELQLYHATINGDKNRVKLRLRFYNDDPDSPVFFEIKRRMNNIIFKQRGAVHRAAAEELLGGQLPEPKHLIGSQPKHLVALQEFCRLQAELRAAPRTHVAYLREAWISPHDNSVRVTLDRDVRTEAAPDLEFSTKLMHPTSVFGRQVVLELKFTNQFPNWFGELVRIFGLCQCGAAKYVDGVTLLDPRCVSRFCPGSTNVRRAQQRLAHRAKRRISPEFPADVPPLTVNSNL